MADEPRRTLPGPPVGDDLVATRRAPDERAVTVPATPSTASQPTLVPGGREQDSPVELPAPGYLIGELIGRGGMGEVLAAVDTRIGREVAIKRMRGEAPSREATARFLREAMVQARLDHPAIAPVHELGADETGQPYFTMKRLTGVTLAAKLADGGATLQLLLRAFVDVCRAISFAHARGVVHGDLKPANIMLGEYGEVYVIDWGIARVVDTARPAPAPVDGAGPSTPLGTPGYMAPEQLRDGTALPASDAYALGSILFELLAGEPLHPRGTLAIVSTLSTPAASPLERRPDRHVPVELDAITRAALVDDPAARPTARTLADDV
ncbi:MAG: serine/threonine protein kinase, partial [Deltaproteobacteria bacterium]|nr:serine/threonine protein kinase [Deltaproteobacteria bacterium]